MERVDKVGAMHQASAIRAALRTAGSTSPPSQIGGRGLCLGLTLAFVVETEVSAVVGHAVLGPETLDQLQALGQAPDALALVHAHGLELLGPVAQAGAEHVIAVGQPVEGRSFLGRQYRIHHRQQQDAGADLHAGCVVHEMAEQRVGLEHAHGSSQQVLAHEQGGEAAIAGRAHLLAQRLQKRPRTLLRRPLHCREQADAHASSPGSV
jgi:hypothetical protein